MIRRSHFDIPSRRAFPYKSGLAKIIKNQAKVTPEQVREIRRRYAAGGITQDALGKEYGLKQNSIHDIVARKKWPDLED